MESLEIIKLFNRDVGTVLLQHIDSEPGWKYKLVCLKEEDEFILQNMNVSHIPGSKKEYRFVDPSGGPMIGIGSVIGDMKVCRIYFDEKLHTIVIELK